MYFALQSSTCTTDEHHQVSYLDQDWGGGGGGGGTPLHAIACGAVCRAGQVVYYSTASLGPQIHVHVVAFV